MLGKWYALALASSFLAPLIGAFTFAVAREWPHQPRLFFGAWLVSYIGLVILSSYATPDIRSNPRLAGIALGLVVSVAFVAISMFVAYPG